MGQGVCGDAADYWPTKINAVLDCAAGNKRATLVHPNAASTTPTPPTWWSAPSGSPSSTADRPTSSPRCPGTRAKSRSVAPDRSRPRRMPLARTACCGSQPLVNSRDVDGRLVAAASFSHRRKPCDCHRDGIYPVRVPGGQTRPHSSGRAPMGCAHYGHEEFQHWWRAWALAASVGSTRRSPC